MRVTVHYFAQLRRAAGVASETVMMEPDATLAQLIQRLVQGHGDAFRAMALDGADQPQRTLLYAVGDDQADLDRLLRDGDAVTILAPMAGG
ncbi:MAG: MoaD/ThiS family protein [Gemmataceae bacterium]|nr:MoaD/ThiS family protein [Gemmataceae bacterium]